MVWRDAGATWNWSLSDSAEPLLLLWRQQGFSAARQRTQTSALLGKEHRPQRCSAKNTDRGAPDRMSPGRSTRPGLAIKPLLDALDDRGVGLAAALAHRLQAVAPAR